MLLYSVFFTTTKYYSDLSKEKKTFNFMMSAAWLVKLMHSTPGTKDEQSFRKLQN